MAPAQGLYPYPGPVSSDAISAQIQIVAKRNFPDGLAQKFQASWYVVVEACLRARGLLYAKQNAGDCPAPAAVPGVSSGQIVGLSGQAASGVVGGLESAGALAGPETLGISTAVSVAVAAISSIFTHHDQAVANEQATICAVVGYFNPIITQIDRAVKSGQISDQDGISYLRQVGQQAITGLAGIYQQCNYACQMTAIIRAHIDFAGFFYPLISPISTFTANRPGQSPTTINAPGAVVDGLGSNPIRSVDNPAFAYQPAIISSAPPVTPNKLLPSGCTICPDYLNQGYRQETGQSAQAADVPPTGQINWVMIGAIAAIIAAFIALLAVLR